MFNQCEQFANFYKALNLMVDLQVGGEYRMFVYLNDSIENIEHINQLNHLLVDII